MQKSLTFLYSKIDNFNSMFAKKLGPENNGMEDKGFHKVCKVCNLCFSVPTRQGGL